MRLLITGTSNLTFSNIVEEEFLKLKGMYPNNEKFVIISCGALGGVDADARVIARKYDLEYLEFKPVNFKKYGFVAKEMRNTEMLRKGKPNLVWIFHQNPMNSKNFNDLIEKVKRRRIGLTIFKI